MNKGSKPKARAFVTNGTQRRQLIEALSLTLGHESQCMTSYYVTDTVRDNSSAQMERHDKAASMIRHMAEQQWWLKGQSFDFRPLNGYTDTDGGQCRPVCEHAAASVVTLCCHWEGPDRVEALRARLAAVDEQLRLLGFSALPTKGRA